MIRKTMNASYQKYHLYSQLEENVAYLGEISGAQAEVGVICAQKWRALIF